MPAQATKSEATIIKALHERLKNIIEIQDSQICKMVRQQSVTQ